MLEFDCGCKFNILDDKEKDYDGLPSIEIDYYNLDYDCPLAWQVFSESTKGVFQLETNLGQTWSKKLKPTSIEELAALGSLLRPGCLKAISDGKSMTAHYVDRKNGLEPSVAMHESISEILSPTYHVLTYQEQTIKIAQKVAGFDLKDADILRRAMGKKDSELMTKVEQTFLEGVKKTGILTEEEGKEIWANIRKSERYSFNKSHAVSYAIIGYWTAYVKAHFPVHFYASWLSFAKYKLKGKEEIRDLVRDAKYASIKVNNPSILQMTKDFSIKGKEIYFGVSNIKGIGEAQFEKSLNTVKEQEKLLNKNIRDFTWLELLIYLLPNLSKTVVNNLILVGAFEHLKYDRKKMLYDYNIVKNLTDREQKQLIENKSKSILEGLKELKVNKSRQKTIDSLILTLEKPSSSLDDNLTWINKTEEDLLGIPITVTKLDAADGNAEGDTTCKEFKDGKTGNVSISAEIVQAKETTTKRGQNPGQKMAFITVEDDSETLDNIIAFPSTWEEYKNILYKGNTVLISGYRSKQNSLVVQSVRQL